MLEVRRILDTVNFVASGIKVFVATVNPEGPEFHHANMMNGNDIGAVGPISRSAFRAKKEVGFVVELVENAIRKANATIINFSENLCLGDVCQVVSMREGEPV